jgi:glycosyltransferase involved in cell wall biosynthesis
MPVNHIFPSVFKTNYAGSYGKIRVLGLLPRRHAGKFPGSSYIRLIRPLGHPCLKTSVDFSPITLERTSKFKANIVIVQRTAVSDERIAHGLIARCKKKKIRILYEMDDNLFESPEFHVEINSQAGLLRCVRIFIKHADMITVPTVPLQNYLIKFNPNVRVIPNALDEHLWLPSRPKTFGDPDRQGRLRIIYMGTRTHQNDLFVVEAAMKRIMAEYGERVVLDIVGVVPQELKSDWLNIIPVPNDNYPDFVCWLRETACWSMGIAPLQHTEFNRCKSHLKFLDYSALGLATICSNITPYQEIIDNGLNGILADNTAASWYHCIKSLIENEAMRINMARQAYENLETNGTLQTQGHRWHDALVELLGGKV